MSSFNNLNMSIPFLRIKISSLNNTFLKLELSKQYIRRVSKNLSNEKYRKPLYFSYDGNENNNKLSNYGKVKSFGINGKIGLDNNKGFINALNNNIKEGHSIKNVWLYLNSGEVYQFKLTKHPKLENKYCEKTGYTLICENNIDLDVKTLEGPGFLVIDPIESSIVDILNQKYNMPNILGQYILNGFNDGSLEKLLSDEYDLVTQVYWYAINNYWDGSWLSPPDTHNFIPNQNNPDYYWLLQFNYTYYYKLMSIFKTKNTQIINGSKCYLYQIYGIPFSISGNYPIRKFTPINTSKLVINTNYYLCIKSNKIYFYYKDNNTITQLKNFSWGPNLNNYNNNLLNCQYSTEQNGNASDFFKSGKDVPNNKWYLNFSLIFDKDYCSSLNYGNENDYNMALSSNWSNNLIWS